jgi:hypothetical protein
MKKPWARVYLIAALLTAGCVVGERHEATIERKWPASGIRTVKIDGVDGSLTVEAGAASAIVLVATVRSRGFSPQKGAENDGYFETELVGDTLQIGHKKKRVRVHFPFFSQSEVRVDYALKVPPTVALDLKTVNGRIATRGIEGETQLVTVNGQIDAEVAGKSEMSARAINGRIRATFVRDFTGANLRTVNGRVEAILPASASFRCNLSQVNGDFEASFPLSIHSHPGSRRVSGEVNGGRYSLRITTVNGDVEVQHTTSVAPKPVS